MFPWLLYRDWRTGEQNAGSLWTLALWAVIYLLVGVGIFLAPRLLTILVASTCLVVGMQLLIGFWRRYGDWRRQHTRKGG